MTEARSGDIRLTSEELRGLSFFKLVENSKYLPALETNPEALVLRRYSADEVIWHQGDQGGSAFYILTTDDVASLARNHPEIEQPRNSPDGSNFREVAKVLFNQALVAPAERPLERGSWWPWRRKSSHPAPAENGRRNWPRSIPFDGPTDIDGETLDAVMGEGELFGESGCLEGIPRTATVVASCDWYMLEMARNILATMLKDRGYQAYMDRLYRERGLGLHLRKFSIFADMDDTAFEEVLRHIRGGLDGTIPEAEREVTLVDCKHGQILCHEHEPADSMYIIRGGLVQVVKNISPLLEPADVLDRAALCIQIRKGAGGPDLCKDLWARLTSLHMELPDPGETPGGPTLRRLLDALNRIILDDTFASDPASFADQAAAVKELTAAHKARKKEPGRFGRLLLEALFPEALRRQVWDSSSLILAYRSRGETIGEMGVVRTILSCRAQGESLDRMWHALPEPRNATCIAFVQEQSKLSEVRLLRISARLVERLAVEGSPLLARLEEVARSRQQETEALLAGVAPEPGRAAVQSEQFEAMGLAQGQRLMLIDLARCTRCDECVRACVSTHSDHRARLFLDGPRFIHNEGGRDHHYLVPLTCRSCRNPECMMNCPVGSIHRGSSGQIVIEDWCIGCKRCSLYCPFGAIHMYDIGVVPEGSPGWRLALDQDGPSDWHKPSFSDRRWEEVATPYSHEHTLRETSSAGFAETGFCFRRRFDCLALEKCSTVQAQLRVTTAMGASINLWVNGTEVTSALALIADESKKRKAHVRWGTIQTESLNLRENVLAVRVQPGKQETGLLFDAGLYLSQRPVVGNQGPVVEQAVVCDLCGTLPSGPACVNACPHDATLRVDARDGIAPW
jgi:Fe-S-cluster-containing hydrogenase component 2/CRP-like cAMP-binding protein